MQHCVINLPVNGPIVKVEVPEKKLTNQFLREQIDGDMDIVNPHFLNEMAERVGFEYADYYLIVDDDGYRKELPDNRAATICYAAGQYRILGDALICRSRRGYMEEPDPYALDEEEADWVIRLITRIMKSV